MDHRTPPARWRLLLLPLSPLLLLLLCCAPGRAASGVAMHVSPNVTGFLGESAALICDLTYVENKTMVTQVTWMKKNSDGSRSTLAVLHPKKGPSITDSDRVKFLASKPDRNPLNASQTIWNASLAMSHLHAEDEGVYECQFATFPTGSISDNVWLQVIARPRTTAEALKPSPTLKLQEVAKCVSTGGRPPPRINWSPNLNGSIHETREPVPQLGTVTVTSVYSLVPSSQADGKNITCQVEHISLQEPDLQTVPLSLPYPPEVSISGYDNDWYVGRTEVALTCEARSKPEPTSYNWSTATGPLPSTSKPEGNRLLIPTVDMDTLNNVTFICNVTNALGSGQGQITVTVKTLQSDSGLGIGAIIGIIVAIVMAVCIITLGAFLRRKCGRSPRSRTPGRNEYSSVSNGSSPQNIEMNNTTR